jgi:hypothetical protein
MDRKEYLRNYQREWKKKNREKLLAGERARYASQSPEQKAEKVAKNREYRKRVRLEAIQEYGGRCTCCGESTPEFLCFDHINNNGAEHRKTMKDKSIALWLRRNGYPEGFQILCHNCNISKGVYGECPHKKERR